MKRCIITLFCIIDNYCKVYEEWEESKLIPSVRKRRRSGSLRLSELLTIVLYFYISPCKDFKNYYLYHLSCKYRGYFSLPSYSWIIQLWPRLVLPLTIMLQLFTGDETGIYFVDIQPNYRYVMQNVQIIIKCLVALLK